MWIVIENVYGKHIVMLCKNVTKSKEWDRAVVLKDIIYIFPEYRTVEAQVTFDFLILKKVKI